MKLIGVFILFIVCLSTYNGDRQKLTWKDNQKLKWSDFKGTPSGSPDYVASTNSGISFSYSFKIINNKVDLSYTVESNFYPELSWFRNGNVTQYILEHEQTHFDISELYARILKKRLDESEFDGNVKQEIEYIYNSNEKKRQSTQQKYDRETEHSKNFKKEYQWRTYVSQQLKKYERWK